MNRQELANLLSVAKLPDYLSEIDCQIERSLASAPLTFKQSLLQLTGAGKRLRPALAIAVNLKVGGTFDEQLIAGCTALELLHNATLIHDDIIDKSDVRHGRPTIYQGLGVNEAILAGDWLISASLDQALAGSRQIAAIVNRAFANACAGQDHELEFNFNINRSAHDYIEAVWGKTGALFAAACEIGALCAGLNQPAIQTLVSFGQSFGLVFQIADDITDLVGMTEVTGKSTGNDLSEGVYTLPTIFALESNNALGEILAHKDLDKSELHKAIQIINRSGGIKRGQQVANDYARVAKKNLTQLADYPKLRDLNNLVSFFVSGE